MNLLNIFRKHFSFVNSKGVRYYLYKTDVTLRGGKDQTIYYFHKDPNYVRTVGNPAYKVAKLPSQYRVNENPRNGFLTVVRKQDPNELTEHDG